MDYKPSNKRHNHDWQGFTFWGGSLEQPDISSAIADNHTISQPEISIHSFPLSQAQTGDFVWVEGLMAGKEGVERLISMGLNRGVQLEVINSTARGSIMVAICNTRLGLGAEIADKIRVRYSEIPDNPLPKSPFQPEELQISSNQQLTDQQLTEEQSMQTSLHLRDLAVGSQGRVTGYAQGSSSYRQKLLAMGLTPGVEFIITRQAPLGDPVELQVRGFQLSLRKVEADALIVESIDHA